jgi:hypothetical protein
MRIAMSDGDCPNPQSTRDEAYALFLDEKGQPQLIDCAVLFWDVMGVRAMSVQSSHQALADLRGLRAAVSGARDRANTEHEEFLRCSSWFTDNVVLAAPVWGPMDEEMVIGPTQVDAAYMQLLMVDAGYLSRGAITFGPHFMDRSFVFGPALIEANDLESGKPGDGGKGVNRWPYVIVSDDVAKRNRGMAKAFYAEPKHSGLIRELLIDEDDVTFVNQLGIWIEEEDDERMFEGILPEMRARIMGKLNELESGGRVWEKWRWLADYHDYVLTDFGLDDPRFTVGLEPRFSFRNFAETL